jgi:hypothetical protein
MADRSTWFMLGEPMNVAELGGRKRAAKAMEDEVRQTLAVKLARTRSLGPLNVWP